MGSPSPVVCKECSAARHRAPSRMAAACRPAGRLGCQWRRGGRLRRTDVVVIARPEKDKEKVLATRLRLRHLGAPCSPARSHNHHILVDSPLPPLLSQVIFGALRRRELTERGVSFTHFRLLSFGDQFIGSDYVGRVPIERKLARVRTPRVIPRESKSLLQANITIDHRSQITEKRE